MSNNAVKNLLLCLLLLIPIFSYAEPELDIPQGTGDLPDLTQKNSAGVIVNPQSIDSYRKIIADELVPFINNGELILEVARHISNEGRLDATWLKNSEISKSTLTDDKSPGREFKVDSGFPFGDSSLLLASSDEKTTGLKILWNSYAIQAVHKILSLNIDMRLQRADQTSRSINASLVRVFPTQLGKSYPVPQLFRESFTLATPQLLRSLSWLTIRQLGNREDGVWMYSPGLRQVVRLTGSNRTDTLFSEGPSAEDLLIWSGKPENLEITSLSESVRLIPILPKENLNFAPSSSACGEVNKIEPVQWNIDTRRFRDASGWVPSNTIFIPRSVWRIEFTSTDIQSKYGRQILYVDSETMLPIYKFAFDRSGSLLRAVIGIMSWLNNPKSEILKKFPFIIHSVISDRAAGSAITLDTNSIEFCRQFTGELTLEKLDPSEMIPADVKNSSGPGKSAEPKQNAAEDGSDVQD